MKRLLKILLFALLIKPIVFILLGLNMRCRERFPIHGPAVIAANHNSHLDALVLMSLFPLMQIHRVRPVAAADYFFRHPLIAWFCKACLGIIPFDRSGNGDIHHLFAECLQALDAGDILIIFPEGSRGNPEQLGRIRKGIFYLLKDHPSIPIIPVVMRGLGRALPKGGMLFVPFNCHIAIGAPLPYWESTEDGRAKLSETFDKLLVLTA